MNANGVAQSNAPPAKCPFSTLMPSMSPPRITPWAKAASSEPATTGDFVFVAGMRGIDPATDALVPGEEARVRQAFRNMQLIAESAGASLRDAVRLVVYVTDMARQRPLVDGARDARRGAGPGPPRRM